MVHSAGLGNASEDRVAFRGWFAKLAEDLVFPTESPPNRNDPYPESTK